MTRRVASAIDSFSICILAGLDREKVLFSPIKTCQARAFVAAIRFRCFFFPSEIIITRAHMSTSTTTPASHDPMAGVQESIKRSLGAALKAIGAGTPEITFEIPPDTKFGDLSSPVCMGLARTLKRNPRQIATDTKAKLERRADRMGIEGRDRRRRLPATSTWIG